MPIEIREIIIKATVNQSDSGATGATSVSTSTNSQNPNSNPLQECVDQVMQILQDKNER